MILLAVNYHYFSPERPTAPRAIFPTAVGDFADQLAALGREFDFVSRDDLLAAVQEGRSLPPRACMITFDDGLREQYELALPVLERMGVPALFFCAGQPLDEPRALHVHKVHWLRERLEPAEFSRLLADELARDGSDALPVSDEFATAMYRYDDLPAARLKYLLNVSLQPAVRERVIDAIFARACDSEERFARRLYLGPEQVRELEERHGAVGAHAYAHRSLATLSSAELRDELERNAQTLGRVTGRRPRFVSYPYGSAATVSFDVARTARALGYVAGFTMERAINRSLREPLLLGRVDTNDAPGGKSPLFELRGEDLRLRRGIAPGRTRYFEEPVPPLRPPVPEEQRRTVALAASQGFAARFLLRTDILPTLQASGARIVILVPNADEAYIADEFTGPDVAIERFHDAPSKLRESRWWWLLNYLRNYTLAHPRECRALLDKYAGARRRVAAHQPVVARLADVAVRGLWRSRALRRLALEVEERLSPRDLHADVFERHRPDLVVTATPGTAVPDALLLREARRRGVPTAATVLGWDNPTSKGYRGADPDRIVVWSERMAEQMERHHDYPRARTFVGGVPHFDRYSREGALPTHADLFTRLGLDPERKLVLFATSSPAYYPHNLEVARSLAEATSAGALGAPAQLVVRLHPIIFREGVDESVAGYERLAAEHPHVHLDVPDVLSDRLRCDMAGSEDARVHGLIKHCDALVNVFSTTTLEAFLVDRPVVMVASRALSYNHMRALLEDEAAPVAYSMDEVVALTREALEHPERRRELRKRIARTECGLVDGRAGERIGTFLAQLAGLPVPPVEPAPAPADEPLVASAGR